MFLLASEDFSSRRQGRGVLYFSRLIFNALYISVAAALIKRVDVDCRRKLDNLDFGGLRARVSTRGDSLRNFCIDRSAARAERPHALPVCTHA